MVPYSLIFSLLFTASEDPDLLVKVAEAKTLLAREPVGTSRIGGDSALLAVWAPEHGGDIRLVQVIGGISRTKGFTVSVVRRNGVNSEFRVTEPAGHLVLAIKTNVKDAPAKRRGKKRSARHREVVYVPYNADLHTAEMVETGRNYLISVLDRAAGRLDAAEVKSRTDSDALATEMVSERVLLAMLVIEHVTPKDFELFGTRMVTERVFVTLALNDDDAYDHARSRAGALGLAQFIPGTYALMLKRYPEAGLDRDFGGGMRDHVNAAMAQYCLADWSLTKLPPEKFAELSSSEREEELGAYLAAAYNGGENRASEAYLKNPERWAEPKQGLAKETIAYVRNFRAVYRYLFPPPPPAPPAPEPPAPTNANPGP